MDTKWTVMDSNGQNYKIHYRSGENMAKAELKDWIALGNQSKVVLTELFKLLSLSNKVGLPKSISKYITTSTSAISDFKMKAENRMFEQYPELDNAGLKIFYGDNETDV